MKKILLIFSLALLFPFLAFGQSAPFASITMVNNDAEIDTDLRYITNFLDIEYKKINFLGEGIDGKSFRIVATEIWNGEIVDSTTVIDTSEFPATHLQKISGEEYELRVISKLTEENKLRMMFRFPSFSTTREFDAVDTNEYSLRQADLLNKKEITSGETFFLLNYILPYEENGVKHYCSVGQSGSDVFNWGREFDLEHYIVFTMTFE
ncbi:MAG: hypothetical protein RI575_06565 [Balneolaceae bacterium]|nr:hypothetical protein [Balneolaceae bacterium]